jgi:hypothetical protein
MHTIFYSENLKGRDISLDLGVDERIIFNGSWGTILGGSGMDSPGSG